MSGGVDSTAAAVLLKEAGYEVIGATMLLWRDRDLLATQEKVASKAKDLARRLDIPHFTLDLSEPFYEQVVSPFIRAYQSGETPNPCVICNQLFKFTLLPEAALEAYRRQVGNEDVEFDYVATGHYARVLQDPETGEFQVYKAKDLKKDQSYVLWTLNQEQLSRLLLPLGDLSKEDARKIAADAGTPIPREEESQDICFISRTYTDLLRDQGGFGRSGWFVDDAGNALAPHPGLARFTLGQRKKLGVSMGKKVAVTDIDPISGNIRLGDESELYDSEIALRDLQLNFAKTPELPLELTVSTRYQQEPTAAILYANTSDNETISYRLRMEEAQRAASPGQSAVFYLGDRMIGGGFIVRKKAPLHSASAKEDRVVQLAAPAKINLSLQILSRQDDGYHQLESLMHTVSLADQLTLSALPAKRATVHLNCNNPDLPGAEGNLAYDAAKAWLEAANKSWAVEIILEKIIPSQAGLGGGSSDAAAVLRALQELAGDDKLPAKELLALARSLGSDVPFFLSCGAAIITASGENIQELNPCQDLFVLIAKPSVSCSTGAMFGLLDEKREQGLLPNRRQALPLPTDPFSHLRNSEIRSTDAFVNDFTPIAREHYPEIALLLKELENSKAIYSMLSGSGSACFALFTEQSEIENCLQKLRQIKELAEVEWIPASLTSQASCLKSKDEA